MGKRELDLANVSLVQEEWEVTIDAKLRKEQDRWCLEPDALMRAAVTTNWEALQLCPEAGSIEEILDDVENYVIALVL